MEKKLKQHLDKAFAPYGEFPARSDVMQELLSNLIEKYHNLKNQGKSDDEAYQATVNSIGDISEIMDQVAHDEPGNKPRSNQRKYNQSVLDKADLSESD